MELLCPNCQQRVTVPDQYAGQVMQCPLCHNTFTTPSLTTAAAPAYIPPPASPPPPEPFVPLSVPAAHAETEPVVSATAPAQAPGDYRRHLTIWFSPRVLPWIAVASLVIAFVLMFFAWAGYFPGGVPVATQSGWRAAFGGYTRIDEDLKKFPPLSTPDGKNEIQPGAQVLLIFFAILLVVALIVSIASAVLGILPLRLPAPLEGLKPWRWGIVSAIAFLAFLFLALQLLSGFNLANSIRERALGERASAPADASGQKLQEIRTGAEIQGARYGCSLWCSLWLTLLALLCAILTFLLGRRTNRPVPRLELAW
jgi:hypothetical protein